MEGSPNARPPLVSVCVPLYNGSEYLEECLSSVASQDFVDFEVLIVDDCSTDDGPDIARRWIARDPRFRLIVNEKNLGLVGNWNRCIELARGEWVKFLFQDDLVAPQCLSKMLEAGRSGNGFVACARTVVYDSFADDRLREWYFRHEKTLQKIYFNRANLGPDEYARAKLAALELNIVGEPSVTLIRRSLFERFGLFDPLLVQLCDSEMWNRLACNVGIDYVAEKLVSFRVHRASASQANQARRFRAGTLDEIVEWTRLCQSTELAPFRRFARSTGEWKRLKRRLIRCTNAAFDEARAAAAASPPNVRLADELRNVLSMLPGYTKARLIYFLFRVRRLARGR